MHAVAHNTFDDSKHVKAGKSFFLPSFQSPKGKPNKIYNKYCSYKLNYRDVIVSTQ